MITLKLWRPFILQMPDQTGQRRVAFAKSLRRLLAHCERTEIVAERELLLQQFALVHNTREATCVRRAIIDALPLIVGPDGNSCTLDSLGSSSTLKALIYQLRRTLEESGDAEVVMALGRLGEALQGTLLFEVVVVLVKRLADRDMAIRSAAYDQIERIAAAHGISAAALVSEHKHSVYPLLVAQLLDHPRLVDEVSSAIFDLDTGQFLHLTLPHILPCIVADQSHELLKELASRLGTSTNQLLLSNLHHIFSHLLVEDNPQHQFEEVSLSPNKIVHNFV